MSKSVLDISVEEAQAVEMNLSMFKDLTESITKNDSTRQNHPLVEALNAMTIGVHNVTVHFRDLVKADVVGDLALAIVNGQVAGATTLFPTYSSEQSIAMLKDKDKVKGSGYGVLLTRILNQFEESGVTIQVFPRLKHFIHVASPMIKPNSDEARLETIGRVLTEMDLPEQAGSFIMQQVINKLKQPLLTLETIRNTGLLSGFHTGFKTFLEGVSKEFDYQNTKRMPVVFGMETAFAHPLISDMESIHLAVNNDVVKGVLIGLTNYEIFEEGATSIELKAFHEQVMKNLREGLRGSGLILCDDTVSAVLITPSLSHVAEAGYLVSKEMRDNLKYVVDQLSRCQKDEESRAQMHELAAALDTGYDIYLESLAEKNKTFTRPEGVTLQ